MIMKNLHISMAFIFVLLLITASCSDKDDSAPRVIPTMNLTVSEIADNTALITSEQQTGTTCWRLLTTSIGTAFGCSAPRKDAWGARR